MIYRLFNKNNYQEKNTILIIEDNKSMLFLLKSILSNHFEVISFSSPVDARSWLSQGNSVDAIISDINMESESGIDFAKNINYSNSTASTPLIFLSAESEQQNHNELSNISYSAYIQKPFNPENLINKVKEATQLAFPHA